MKGKSTKSNECVVHFLYGYEISGTLIDPSDLKMTMKLLLVSKNKVEEARESTIEICNQLDSLDAEISNVSKEYEFDRISKIDLSILRWAFYLLRDEEIDKRSLINEAIRLSKKFSSVEASKFIHAILDDKVKSESQTTCSV